MKTVQKMNGILQALVILAAVVCLFTVSKNSSQAALSMPLFQNFTGEYSQEGGEWLPLDTDTMLSAYDGDVILRGHLEYGVPEGALLNFYLNHIGYSFSINGEPYSLSAVMETGMNSSVCGREWGAVLSPEITAEDTIEIHLHNPHRFGNRLAFREFLDSLCTTSASSEILEKYLEPCCMPFKLAGGGLLILSLLLFGASIASFVLKSTISAGLAKSAFLLLFAGGYLLLDTLDCFFSSGLRVFRTYAGQMSMMLFALWLGFCLLDLLEGKEKKAAGIAVRISAAVDMIFFVLSFTGVIVIYDTELYWMVLQVILCFLYLVLCGRVWKRVPRGRQMFLISFMLLCISMLLDFAGVAKRTYSQGTCTKAVFVCLTVCGIIRTVKCIINDHQASVRIKGVEKELEESRISIMLSQIQPHFLYNSLNTIYHLCDKDVEAAKRAINDFSEYLRMNLKSLDRKSPVSFQKEMKLVKTYLELEKRRFDEELDIRYEIGPTDFELPALTVQPLVENAVRHGICPKDGGGTVIIRTDETQEYYTVTVTDDGVGFDPESAGEDGKVHIGIENVRRRLQTMCRATLLVESIPGKGTTAMIRIPKEERADADRSGR